MFGRLFGCRSDPLRTVLRRANREAIRWNRREIDTEHLLLGLVSYDEEQGSGDALGRLGLAAGRLREAIESRMATSGSARSMTGTGRPGRSWDGWG